MTELSPSRGGAYGYAIEGLESGLTMLNGNEPPLLRIRHRTGLVGEEPDSLTEHSAELHMASGRWRARMAIDRERRTATVVRPEPLGEDELLHPCLMRAGAVFAHWEGRETLHAGAVLGREGAWCVLGSSGAGKSTLLASLALGGLTVLSDDMLVVTGDRVFAGPRCIDLTPQAVRRLGADGTTSVRQGFRRRLALGAAPFEAPLRGWIQLGWGEDARLEAIPARERLARLGDHRLLDATSASPATVLQLAALPAWRLERPRDLPALERSAEPLLELIES